MNGDLGEKEIKEFIKNLIDETGFSVEQYLDEHDFSYYYYNGKTCYQLSCYRRFKFDDEEYYGKKFLDIIKEDKIEEFESKVIEINKAIEDFIKELAYNEDIVPRYERSTFLYYRRVPDDFGILYNAIFKRNKEEEDEEERIAMEEAKNNPHYDEDNWRPGDARWDAPGMSIHDFI